MMRRLLIVVTVAMSLAMPALAVQPGEVLDDPALEARARTISADLRCLVCQNQSIDDSDAPLARDLRVLVRERLKAGDSNAAILDFVVARYGEFVLLRPRMTWRNALLWASPVLLIAIGSYAAWHASRRRRRDEPAPLSPQEEAELKRLLAQREERVP